MSESTDEPTATTDGWRSRLPSGALLRGGARGFATLAAAALGVAVIVATSVTTQPRYQIPIPGVVVDPVPAESQRLCPGPVLRLGGSTGEQATVATSAGRPAIFAAAMAGEPVRSPLQSTDDVSGVAPELLSLPSAARSADEPSALAGSQSQQVDSGTFAGFAAADCSEAVGDSWLVAGATTTGRTSLISLSNPSSVEASVDLELWGPTGVVAAPGSTGIIVPAGSQRIYPLAGFAPGLDETVVRVQSRGGPIVASMHESIVRTLAAGGVDIAGPGIAPSTAVSIPGVVISGADAVTAAGATAGFEDLAPVVRLLAPGADATSATVTIARAPRANSADPETEPAAETTLLPETTSFRVALEPGMVQDVPIPGLADGAYTVSIVSTEPVVGAVRVSTITAEGVADLAWFAAGRPLGSRALIAVAPGPRPILTLANPAGEAASVTLGASGVDTVIEIAAGASVSWAVADRSSVELSDAEGLVGSITYSGPGALASFPVSVPAANSTAVRTYR